MGCGTRVTTLDIVKHVDANIRIILDLLPHQLDIIPTENSKQWSDAQHSIREAYKVLKIGEKSYLIGLVYPTFWLSCFFSNAWVFFPMEEEYIEWFDWYEKDGFKNVKLKTISPKWYNIGEHHHGLIMGCSVTIVKPVSGDFPLQLGPNVKDIEKLDKPLVFPLCLMQGAIAGTYYVLVRSATLVPSVTPGSRAKQTLKGITESNVYVTPYDIFALRNAYMFLNGVTMYFNFLVCAEIKNSIAESNEMVLEDSRSASGTYFKWEELRAIVEMGNNFYIFSRFEYDSPNNASGTSDNGKVVIDHGVVLLFVQLLNCPSHDICEQVEWVLDNVRNEYHKGMTIHVSCFSLLVDHNLQQLAYVVFNTSNMVFKWNSVVLDYELIWDMRTGKVTSLKHVQIEHLELKNWFQGSISLQVGATIRIVFIYFDKGDISNGVGTILGSAILKSVNATAHKLYYHILKSTKRRELCSSFVKRWFEHLGNPHLNVMAFKRILGLLIFGIRELEGVLVYINQSYIILKFLFFIVGRPHTCYVPSISITDVIFLYEGCDTNKGIQVIKGTIFDGFNTNSYGEERERMKISFWKTTHGKYSVHGEFIDFGESVMRCINRVNNGQVIKEHVGAANEPTLRTLGHHLDDVICYILKVVLVFIFANQVGFDMLDTSHDVKHGELFCFYLFHGSDNSENKVETYHHALFVSGYRLGYGDLIWQIKIAWKANLGIHNNFKVRNGSCAKVFILKLHFHLEDKMNFKGMVM